MNVKTIVIVGGVAGGATTAARLRRVDENANIIMLERGPHISYANCGLPYYIGGVITDREQLLIQTPKSFGDMFNVDVRVLNEVIDIDANQKSVKVKKLENNEEYDLSYDQLVLSPGAKPLIPPLPGINNSKVYTLRNVDDTDRIKKYLDEEKPQSAVVIGAGFIGLEMAENLRHREIKVNVVEAAPQVLNMLDPEMAAMLHQHFKEEDVGLYLNDKVLSFEERSNKTIEVKLNSGKTIVTDFVILSIGVKPDVNLAEKADLKLGPKGGIWVDQYLQTSKKDIYAVGDAIEFAHPITKKSVLTYLAGPANKQGRILADNLTFGHTKEYKGSYGSAIAKVFDLTAATTGLSDKILAAAGVAHQSTIVHGGSHAGYYPGSMQMTLKISFDPKTGKLLGGQAVGYKSVDKRIDLVTTVIQSEGTIYDLQEIEQSYAPPFNSAKDLVNQIGFNAENIIKGFFKPVSPEQLDNRDLGSSILVDVRTTEENLLGSIEGSLNIPVQELRENLDKLDKSKAIYVYCAVGLRGYIAAQILRQNGFEDVYNLSGGMKVYNSTVADQENRIQDMGSDKSCNVSHILSESPNDEIETIEVNACGLQCPGPIMKLKDEIDKIHDGQRLKVLASDAGFYKDVESWCKVTNNILVHRAKNEGVIEAVIEKQQAGNSGFKVATNGDQKTILVFSDDLDRALASFVIANGAAAMGKKVTMFFTFWGLNVIKKTNKPKVKKDLMGKMFSMMMPNNSKKLKLSSLHMGGMGSLMMRKRMKAKNVDALDSMVQAAVDAGVKMIACQMSMDIMGVFEEELLDNVNIGGVANYLEETENSNMNLFI